MAGLGGAEWVEAVAAAGATAAAEFQAGDDPAADIGKATAEQLRSLVTELAVEPMRVAEVDVPRYIGGVLARLQEVWVGNQIADLKSRLQRMSPSESPDEYRALFGDLVALEQYRRGLLVQAVGAREDSY